MGRPSAAWLTHTTQKSVAEVAGKHGFLNSKEHLNKKASTKQKQAWKKALSIVKLLNKTIIRHSRHLVTHNLVLWIQLQMVKTWLLCSIVGKGGHTHPLPTFSRSVNPPFLEIQGVSTFYRPIWKTKALNDSFLSF